jgi:DUF1680 family protein
MAGLLSVVAVAVGLAGGERPDALRLDLGGPVEERAERVARRWLIPAAGDNPAIVAMFRDRDRQPYRNLLPWSGEFAGKHVTGGEAVAALAGGQELDAELGRFVADWLETQADDGYVGPFPKGSRLTGTAPNVDGKDGPTWDAWGHYHAMLGLLARHERTGDEKALEGARRIGDLFVSTFGGGKMPRLVDTGSTEMNLAPAHGMALLYAETKDQRHLDLAEQFVAEFAAEGPDGKPLAGDYLRRGLAGEPFYRTPKPRWESLHPIQALAELHRLTGKEEYRAAFENLWWSIVEYDRHNNGGFSSGEQAQGDPYHQGAIETCCTIAWMAMTVDMLRLSGDSRAADELELATLNSGLGMWSPSGAWSTYNTPMDGDRKANYHEIVFQSRPGSPQLNCCSVNAARGLGMLAEWALLADEEGLFLNWYGPGVISAELSGGGKVELAQETDYPVGGGVRIEVGLEKPSRFELRLRIPSWSADTVARLNGEEIEGVEAGKYLKIDREWDAGDVIELGFDMGLRGWIGERASADRVSLYRGPILLAFDPRYNPGLDGGDPPAIDWDKLPAEVEMTGDEGAAFGLVAVKGTGGEEIVLCDFASAGAEGTPYRSWLRLAGGAAPVPFDRSRPDRTVGVESR